MLEKQLRVDIGKITCAHPSNAREAERRYCKYLEWVSPQSLSPNPIPALRFYSEDQLGRLVLSTRRGLMQPIFVDEDNCVLVGDAQRVVALRIGLQVVPVFRLVGRTEHQRMALMLRSDKRSRFGSVNYEMRRNLVRNLTDAHYAPEDFGYSAVEVEFLLSRDDEPCDPSRWH